MSLVSKIEPTAFTTLQEWIDNGTNAGQLVAFNASGNFGESMVDPLRELGVQRQKIERNQAYRAMTDAANFVDEREAELNALDGQIKAKYYSEFAEYAASGYTTEQCKKKALEAAYLIQEMGENAIETRYGSFNINAAKVKNIEKIQAANSEKSLGFVSM